MKSFICALAAVALAAGTTLAADSASVEGENVLGYTPVKLNSQGYTAITVQFASLAGSATRTAADLISTHNLTGNDAAESAPKLTVYNGNQSCVYSLNGSKAWVKADEAYPDLASITLKSGDAFWFQQGATTADTLYLVGALETSSAGVSIVAGQNLLGNGLPFDVDLAKIIFTGAVKGRGTGAADIIQLVNSDGSTLSKYFFNKDGKWADASNGNAVVSSIPVAAGTAFWYIHKGAGFTVNFAE